MADRISYLLLWPGSLLADWILKEMCYEEGEDIDVVCCRLCILCYSAAVQFGCGSTVLGEIYSTVQNQIY
jgi:hypothetical protein